MSSNARPGGAVGSVIVVLAEWGKLQKIAVCTCTVVYDKKNVLEDVLGVTGLYPVSTTAG